MTRSIAFTLLIVVLLLTACKKSSIEKVSSEIKGNVLLADESGNFFNDNSGMTVIVENSNPLVSTITDPRGNFNLSIDHRLTTFTLIYIKPQIGTFKRSFTKDNMGLFFWDGNDKLKIDQDNEDLSEKSTVVINSFHASIVNDTLKISCNISATDNDQKFIELLSQKNLSNISIGTIDQTRSNWTHKLPVKNGDNFFNFCMKCSSICNDWISGDNIYLVAYGDSYYSNAYVDRTTNKTIMPNLNLNNPSTIVSVVVP